MNLLQKYIEEDLPESELELVSKELIVAQIENRKRKEWVVKLKENYGVEKESETVKWLSNSKKAILLALISALTYYLFSISSIAKSPSNEFADLIDREISDLNIMSDQSVIRKGENDINMTRQKASMAYVDKDYNASIKYWSMIENDNALNASDCFYLATSHLLNTPSNPEKTIVFLTKAREINKIIFSEETDWIISLAYLKSDQMDNAKLELSNIVSRNKYKAETAKVFLEKLGDLE